MATSTLLRLAFVIVATHAVLLAASQWLLLEQFLERTLSDAALPVAAAFRQYTIAAFGLEAAAPAAAAVAITLVRRLLADRSDARRVAALGLIACAPLALWSATVLLALATGWQPDVFVMSAVDAADRDITATIREALPTVLQPVLAGRAAAIVLSAIAFGILHRRLGAGSAKHSAVMAVAAGAAALAAQFAMFGVPFIE